jgi:hypothetical protein
MECRDLPLHLGLLHDEVAACDFELFDSFLGRGLKDAFLLLRQVVSAM